MIFHCSAEFTIVQERRMCYTEIPCGHSGISRGAEPGCWHLSEEFTALFSARSPPKNKICACDGIGRHARFRCCHLREGFLAVFVPVNQQLPRFPAAGEKIGDFIALPCNEIARLTMSTGRFRIYNRVHFYYVKNRNSCFYKRGSSAMLRLGSSPCKKQRAIK